jgi:hypothetical protein
MRNFSEDAVVSLESNPVLTLGLGIDKAHYPREDLLTNSKTTNTLPSSPNMSKTIIKPLLGLPAKHSTATSLLLTVLP